MLHSELSSNGSLSGDNAMDERLSRVWPLPLLMTAEVGSIYSTRPCGAAGGKDEQRLLEDLTVLVKVQFLVFV